MAEPKKRNRGKGGIWSVLLTIVAVIVVLLRFFGPEAEAPKETTPVTIDPQASNIVIEGTKEPAATPVPQESVSPESEGMTLTVLEVGKADCLVLQCDGESMIIDGGNDEDEEVILNKLSKMEIKEFKYLVNTHPHEDHLGSLDAVVNAYPVEKAYLSPKEHTTKDYENLIDALDEKQVPTQIPLPGESFTLGGATLTVLSPDPDAEYDGYNDWSIVLLAQYGDVRYLLMGDAETPVESDLLESGVDLHADVLKIGHHGSNTSSKKSFLSAVSPTYALITCDLNEKAGEPNEKVVQRLNDLNIPFLRTDLSGDITVYTDGTDVAVSTERQN